MLPRPVPLPGIVPGSRYLMQRIIAALLLLIPAGVAAQTALSIPPQHCVWRQGDDPRWAAPNLDESDWKPISQWTDISTVAPTFWARCLFQSADLAPTVHPALQISGDLAWQVFADGQLIGQAGNLNTGTHTMGLVMDYDAPQLERRDRPIPIAVRMTFTPQINGQQRLPQVSLGDAEFQQHAYWSAVYERTKQQWLTWVCHALIASAGLFFLALFWFDRTQRFVLWVSLIWLAVADLRMNEFLVAASIHYPARLEFFLYALGQAMPAFSILFFFALAQRPIPRIFKVFMAVPVLETLTLTVAVFLPVGWSMSVRWHAEIAGLATLIVVLASLGAVASPLVAFWPLSRLRRSQIPIAVVCFIWMLMDMAYMFVQFPFLKLNIVAMFLKIQPYRSVAICIVVVSLTLLLVQRIRSTNRERAALQGEMQSARQIQRLLVPEKIASTASWSIDAAFLPARDVGGDFYLSRPLPKGRLRILLGDVSGKGAAAAMTAAMLMGAVEKHEADSPTELLHHLNLVLLDSRVGGLATCLCADLSPDGAVTMASAGHLPPYCGGAELAVDNGLPLGIDPGAAYPQSEFKFAPGSRLTLLTDGVVEARSHSGELFGFDRAARLSTQTAAQMARAAEAFGQDDDITVLTLTALPQGAHA